MSTTHKTPDGPKYSHDMSDTTKLTTSQLIASYDELCDWQQEVREELFALLKLMKSGTMDNASTIHALELLEKLTRK